MPDIVAAATKLREAGFAIAFARAGAKNPEHRQWTLASQEPTEYKPIQNLGILCGKLSGNPVCIDLDGEAALKLADEHLPPTSMIEGRPGKPRSHRYYRVADIPADMRSTAAGGMGGPWLKRFKGADGKPIVDFIGTGGFVVCPPSLHKSGERRQWDEDGEPTTIPLLSLWEAVRQLALACGWVDRDRKAKKATVAVPDDPPSVGNRNRCTTARAVAYLATVQSIEGHRGDNALWRAACALMNGFELSFDAALPLLLAWNETNATPPWDRGVLERKLTQASESGATNGYPRGWLLHAPAPRPFNDPRRLAEEFSGIWRCWHDSLYRYDGRRYELIPDGELLGLLRVHIGERFDAAFARASAQAAKTNGPAPKRLQVASKVVNETRAELSARNAVPGRVAMPSMWPEDSTRRHLLAMQNGLLDVATGELLQHTERWFSTTLLPYAFDAAAVDDVCSRALALWFEGDAERIALAQEWAGYLLTPSTDLQSFTLLIGQGGNGKSVYAAMLMALLGADQCSHLAWQSLGEKFQLISTFGKLLNVSDDSGEFNRTCEATLKWFVGGQPITFERKHKDSFVALPTARLLLNANQPPRIADRSQGVWRRMLTLPFDVRISDSQRVAGMDKPDWWTRNANMAGVLNWALAGLRRLQVNGMRFTVPRRSELVKDQIRQEANPASVYLTEWIVADPNGNGIRSYDLYQRYREWCGAQGFAFPLSAPMFGREVVRTFPGAESKLRKVANKAERYWHGLRWFDHAIDSRPAFGIVTDAG